MLDIKGLTSKLIHKIGDKNQNASDNDPMLEIVRDTPSKRMLGKHISFSIDNMSVQMATVFHCGFKAKLLDISKVYITKSFDTPEKVNTFVNTTIKDYLKNHGGKFTKVSITLLGQSTPFRTFLMPALRKKELNSAIKIELKNQVPFPENNCVFDYRISGEIKAGNRTRYKISLFATTLANVKSQLRAFDNLNINIFNIYNSQDTIGLLLKHLKDFKVDKNYTVLNISQGHTEIAFYKGAQLQFFQSNPVTSAVQGGIQDLTKFEFYTETIDDQLRTSFDFYSAHSQNNPSNDILVYGDLSYSNEILELLDKNSSFNFNRFPIESLDFISSIDKNLVDSLTVSLPVVASAFCLSKPINMLPPNLTEKYILEVRTLYSKIAAAIVVLILAGAWFFINNQTSLLTEKINKTNIQIESFRNSEAFHTYNNLKKQILSNNAYISRIKKEPSLLSFNLKELSLLTLDQIELEHLDFRPRDTENNIILQGTISSQDIPPEIILAEYTSALSSSQFYNNVRIVKYIKTNKENKFVLEFVINMNGVA